MDLSTLDLPSQKGHVPSPRFGHTFTSVGGGKLLLFGGAIGDSGRYTITNETYVYDVDTCTWTKLALENTPASRAAHAAACVDTEQLVIYGGATAAGSLATDELYLLDFRKDTPNPKWIAVPISGGTPGRRYGHIMAYVKPNIILFGGNDGQNNTNDVWYMNLNRPPFTWVQVNLDPLSKMPERRVYHSADVCKFGPAAGMLVIFGGRSNEGKSLNDVWGLRQHRNGKWDWVAGPTKGSYLPEPRYQHSALLVGKTMIIIGGRNDNDCTLIIPCSIYDTEATTWKKLQPIYRYRHSSCLYKSTIYIFGGFASQTQQRPINDLATLNCSLLQKGEEEQTCPSLDQVVKSTMASSMQPKQAQTSFVFEDTKQNIKLSSHAHAVKESDFDFSKMVRKISIDRLEDEGKKIDKTIASKLIAKASQHSNSLCDSILDTLLKPNITMDNIKTTFDRDSLFLVNITNLSTLCNMTLHIVQNESMMLELRAPVKVYGDIHGQYYDLMRLFRLYKCPVEEDISELFGAVGDLDSTDYLFLGDYVDRGSNSLEVITLLFALKVFRHNEVGNHEDSAINSIYGFKDECKKRLHEDPNKPDSIWNCINRVFEWLPVGAIIDNKILAVHGGIGKSIKSVDDIASLPRPLEVAPLPHDHKEQVVIDLLWSDPTDSDNVLGTMINDVRDPEGLGYIVKFGPDRVEEFLKDNNLQMIIRAHECVMDGFERFAGGKLITLFSATNYCNHHKNAGALLFVRRDLTIVPKLIYPPKADIKALGSWDMRMAELRPPTPPRSYQQSKKTLID